MKRVLLIDNYDSFTFNLAQSLQMIGAEVLVHRHDALTVEQAFALEPTHVVISPGPGRPEESGISMEVIQRCLDENLPLLGVCLGHQALCVVLGGRVSRAERILHGKASPVTHDNSPLFSGISSPFQAARYHSLIIEPESVPSTLVISAQTEQGEIMAMRHHEKPAFGVQFHPESILTPEGDLMLANFLGLPWSLNHV